MHYYNMATQSVQDKINNSIITVSRHAALEVLLLLLRLNERVTYVHIAMVSKPQTIQNSIQKCVDCDKFDAKYNHCDKITAHMQRYALSL